MNISLQEYALYNFILYELSKKPEAVAELFKGMREENQAQITTLLNSKQ